MIRTLLALTATLCLGAAPMPATFIANARVFDGTGSAARIANVVIRGDRIAALGKRVRPPRGARIIEARGLTLLPGLHDLHIHTRRQAFESPEALADGYAPYLRSGITSVNEYSVAGEMLSGIRGFARATTPHLALAVRIGVPGGHGTESAFTNGITTQVTTPAQAREAMTRALPFKPDLIKVFADGWRYGRDADKPDMDLPTLRAIVRAARRARLPVVTHTVTLAGAKRAARAGVDAIVHGIGDAPVDGELIRLMKARDTAYVPTLVVYEPQQDRVFLPEEWALLGPTHRAREEARMAAPIAPILPYDARRWAIMQDNVRRLHEAGVRIGVGTDTGIGGIYPGSAALREILWLTKLGFTPREALRAGTSASARIMRQNTDHGRIARGHRADLVLTGGRPDQRIVDLFDVRRVFVSGREVVVP